MFRKLNKEKLIHIYIFSVGSGREKRIQDTKKSTNPTNSLLNALFYSYICLRERERGNRRNPTALWCMAYASMAGIKNTDRK